MASPVAAPPRPVAVRRTACAPAPREIGSPVSRSSAIGRPHRLTCSFCSRNSIAKNPAAVPTKTHQAIGASIRLTGTV